MATFGAEVKLNLSHREITLEDGFELNVSVSNARSYDGMPEVQGMENFEIQSSGQSSNISIINGKMSSEKVFSFYLIPKKEGIFSLGPARIDFEGKKIQSSSVNIKVGASASSREELQGDDSDLESDRKEFFVEADISKKKMYVGEQLVYTFRFFNRGEVLKAELDLPEFNNFWKEKLGEQKEFFHQIHGQEYHVTEFRYALFPTQAGEIVIPSIKLNLQVVDRSSPSAQRRRQGNPFFDDFFGPTPGRRVKRKILRTKEIKIDALATPSFSQSSIKNKIINDNQSDLVGELFLKAFLSKNQVQAGDSVTLTLTLSGDANLRDAKIKLPQELTKKMRFYEDSPEINFFQEGEKLVAEKIFKTAIVVNEAGDYPLHDLKFRYFDPHLEEFRFLDIPPLELHVLPGDASRQNIYESHQSSPKGKENKPQKENLVLQQGVDLRPLMRSMPFFSHTFLKRSFFFFLLFPLFFYFLSKKSSFEEMMAGRKKKNKHKLAISQFKQKMKHLSGSEKEMASSIQEALSFYLAQKFSLPITSFTSADMERAFENKIKIDDLHSLTSFAQSLEALTYGASDLQKTKELKSELEKFISLLDSRY